MSRAILALVAVALAIGWLVYERSLPVRIGPRPFIRDASSLAIGIGVYLFGAFVLARPKTRADLPLARTR